jgi:hypothetical protein
MSWGQVFAVRRSAVHSLIQYFARNEGGVDSRDLGDCHRWSVQPVVIRVLYLLGHLARLRSVMEK